MGMGWETGLPANHKSFSCKPFCRFIGGSVKAIPLSVGSSIEVLWEVELGDGNVKEEWVEDTVKEMGDEKELGNDWKLDCRISYEEGYRNSMDEVSFYITRDGAFWEKGLYYCHIWRSCETGCGVIAELKGRRDEDNDVSWYPQGGKDTEPLQSSCVLKTIERRLERLEQASGQHFIEIERVCADGIQMVVKDDSVGPIQFICHFLNEALCKPPLKTTSRILTSDLRRRLLTFSGGCITVSVNCTFGEFEAVCATVSTSGAIGVEFIPFYADKLVHSVLESEMKVKFPSFLSFLKGIWQFALARAGKSLITERVDRATKKVGSLRIIRGSFLPVSDAQPMWLKHWSFVWVGYPH